MDLPAVSMSQSPEEKFREYLGSRPRPQRFTDQQRDILNFVFSKHNHFDADKLIDDMEGQGLDISRATVYRTLNKLVDAGLLRRIEVGPRMKYESRAFPGLWLCPEALLALDAQRSLRVLQRGLASRDHRAFVKRLQSAAGEGGKARGE